MEQNKQNPSPTLTHKIYLIPLTTAGRLYIMPRPPSQELRPVIAALFEHSVSKLICLLPESEINELGLAREAQFCSEYNIDFTHFPIDDFSLPEVRSLVLLARRCADDLRQGQSICIHCRAGIGRTGTVAGCILRELGFTSDKAVALIGKSRGVAIPDTPAQLQFIRDYEPLAD